MALQTKTSADGNTITVTMPAEFNFHSHKDFRAMYRHAETSTNFILDFAPTHYIDSSAFGMLLLMREELGGHSSRIKIINCQKNVRSLLEMANFHKLFNVA